VLRNDIPQIDFPQRVQQHTNGSQLDTERPPIAISCGVYQSPAAD
jgi:hypothetical protein